MKGSVLGVNAEILTLKTAEKLARTDKVIKYIQEQLNNPFCDERETLKIVLDMLLGENDARNKEN